VRAVAEALAAISGVLGATGFDSDCPVTEVHCRCKPCAEGRTWEVCCYPALCRAFWSLEWLSCCSGAHSRWLRA